MKNKIDRMKTRAATISTRTLAMVMCFIMLLTAIGAGTMMTSFAAFTTKSAADTADGAVAAVPEAEAAETADVAQADTPDTDSSADEPGLLTRTKDAIANVGASVDVAETGWDGSNTYLNIKYDNSWHKCGVNAEGYYDLELTADKDVEYTIYVDGTEYRRNTTYDTIPTFTDTEGYNARTSTWASNANFSTTLKAGKYVFYVGGKWGDGNNAMWYRFYRKRAYYNGGTDNGDWSTTEMTYNGDGAYKFDISGDGKQKRFRTSWVDGGTEEKYYPASTDDIKDNTSYDSKYNASKGDSDNYWYLDTVTGGSYTVWLKDGGVWVTYTEPATTTSYYLTGWINGSEKKTNDSSLKFTETSSGSKVYTLEYTFTGDEGGKQFVTVTDSSSKTYHAASNNSTGGNASTTTDSNPNGDDKWMVGAAKGKKVTFTWDMSGTTPKLTWVVDSSGSDLGTPTTYKVLYGTTDTMGSVSSATVYQKSDGSYYANLSDVITALTNAGTGNFFIALSTDSSNKNIVSSTASVTLAGDLASKYGKDIQSYNFSDSAKQYPRIYRTAACSVLGFTLSYNSNAYTLTLSSTAISDEQGDVVKKVNVYAKDGAAPIDWSNKSSGGASATTGTAYNYAAIATTTITEIGGAAATGVTTSNAGNDSSKYRTASVEAGKTVTIQTQITNSNSWQTKYYVVGWSVNGVTYANGTDTLGVNTSTVTADNGIYKFTYTIPEKIAVNYVEITPIYYRKDATASNTVTFTLEGFDTSLQTTGGWGTTPYAYPFYGNLDNVKNSFGVYPGQPMVYANGKYSIEIPLTDMPIIGSSTKTAIKGVTISNGYADHVHKNLVYGWSAADNDAAHKQTYDYDDFYKIYKEKTDGSGNKPNAIIFRIKDESTTYNRNIYGGGVSGARVTAGKTSISDTVTTGNGYELLTNRYGQPIDLFGNVVSDSGFTNSIKVVSTGYNANIAGDYGTAWKIYNASGTLLTNETANDRYAVPPSIFLLNDENSFNTTTYPDADHSVTGVGSYKDSVNSYKSMYSSLSSSAKNKSVYITYEINRQDTRDDATGTGAYRVDGRWFYTFASESVQSNIIIEYYDNATGKWVEESGYDGTKGSKTGCTAFFTDVTPNSRTSASHVISKNENFTFSATEATNWQFDSWQIKYGENSYQEIKGAPMTGASTPANSSDTIVARFVPVTSGNLTITHTLLGSGEGDVDMEVKVYKSSTTSTANLLNTFTGSRVYLDGTYIGNTPTKQAYYIDVTLKTTPKYDGTVDSFGYDAFNTAKSISATEAKTNTPATSNFGFTVKQLYTGSTLPTYTQLDYTSVITAADHFYEFKYTFPKRGSADTAKDGEYTVRGTMSMADYKTYVTGDHVLDGAFVKAKAPFESNFLKTNTLTVADTYSSSYNSDEKTFKVTVDYKQSDDVPTYHVTFMLPYAYYQSTDTIPDGSKLYTAKSKVYNADAVTFELTAKYDEFVTGDGTQNNVTKVTDATDVNHAGNNFLTAPDELDDNGTTMYFKYWEISKITSAGEAGSTVAKIYYPDFHYRIYGDYYVKAVYDSKPAASWHMTYNNNGELYAAVMYLGDSRNQWNMNGSEANSDSADVAADKIYSDFIFNYNYQNQELKDSTDVTIGMVLERIIDIDNGKWALGSSSVTDMSTYQTQYGGTETEQAARKTAIANWLKGESNAPIGCVNVPWKTSELNNKNYMEQNYSVYSAYGQTVSDHSVEFATDSAIDNYVYRAYAYIKDKDGYVYVSDPAYFCMRYTANRKG